MNRNILSLLMVCALLTSAAAQQPAEKPKTEERPGVSATYHRQLGSIERQVVGAVEAMPADKFAFVPTGDAAALKDIRPFAEQVKHMAAANIAFASAIMGEKSPYTVDDIVKGLPNLKTRDEAVAVLKDSFAKAHKAMDAITEANLTELIASPFDNKMSRMQMANLILFHNMDHYGQLVVYLRLNNVVPPASRPRN